MQARGGVSIKQLKWMKSGKAIKVTLESRKAQNLRIVLPSEIKSVTANGKDLGIRATTDFSIKLPAAKEAVLTIALKD